MKHMPEKGKIAAKKWGLGAKSGSSVKCVDEEFCF